MTALAVAEVPAPNDVLWRSAPLSRLLDYGVDPADVLALQRLTATTAWDVAAEQLAEAQLARARTALAAGRRATAVQAYRFAAADLVFAQLAYNFDVPRKVDLYERFWEALRGAASVAGHGWQPVEAAFAGGRLHGLRLLHPAATATVVVVGGQSGWGAAFLGLADALLLRGLSVLLVEGPGQGLTRMRGGLHLDVDLPGAYSTFVDLLDGPVGLWGNSLGGLYAARTAAADPRVRALCVNGAPAQPRSLSLRTFDEQAAAMLPAGPDGAPAPPDVVQQNFDRIAFRPGEHRIDCPLLLLHGECDPIVSMADQRPFLVDCDQADVTTWADGEHTVYNHAAERNALVADWFRERLTRA